VKVKEIVKADRACQPIETIYDITVQRLKLN